MATGVLAASSTGMMVAVVLMTSTAGLVVVTSTAVVAVAEWSFDSPLAAAVAAAVEVVKI